MNQNTRIAIAGGIRTPFAKAGTFLKPFSALEMSVHAVNGLLENYAIDPEEVDRLVFGTVIVDPSVPHLAREVNFQSRLPESVEALTVTDNCITGTSAIASVHDSIVLGRPSAGIAGGVESMSNPPVLFQRHTARLLRQAAEARSYLDRLRVYAQLRPSDFKPWSYGIAEPSTGLTMGEHTEITVKEWQIDRQAQDRIAFESHQNAHRATEDGRLPAEIAPLGGLSRDSIIRPETSLDALARLSPVFDRSERGTITAGNASPLTDGAAAVLLMSEEKACELGIEPLAFIRDFISVGIHPDDGLLMGPGIAVPRLLARNGLTLADMDIIEMHEAFAGQVAANRKAWQQGWKEPAIGTIEPEQLNPLGSSIAVGHPFAATGARITTTLANELHRRKAKYGLISICGAGATATAMLLER